MQQGNDQSIRHSDRQSAVRNRSKHDKTANDTGQLEQPAKSTNAGNGERGRTAASKTGQWWNIKTPAGTCVAKYFLKRPTVTNGSLKNGQKIAKGDAGGPFESMKVAITRANTARFYPHLVRGAMHRGYMDSWGKVFKPSYREIAGWIDFSYDALTAWMRPITNRSHRPMPRHAVRLILHEFAARDHSVYDWTTQLNLCR